MLYLLLTINLCVFVSAISSNTTNETFRSSDFIFDTPDVVVEYYRENGVKIRLDAYQTKNNIALQQAGQFSGLRWFSLGQPELVNISKESVFGFQKISFWLEFEMLTKRDEEVLADEVKRAKGFSVNPAQFSDLDPNTIECSIELYDSREFKFYILKGKVFNFLRSPYKVEFKYPIGTKERTLFEEEIETEPNLEFKCTVTAGAQIQKSNTFTITLQESNIRLSEKLFGPANESYVTREQLTELSDEVNSYFNVVENYQIPQDQFNSAFVENLISLTGQTTFRPVSFDDALNSLSKYSLDFSNDLNANQITKHRRSMLKVNLVIGSTKVAV